MIDLHAHVLPLVDDGSNNLTDSLKMLIEAEAQGVTDIVLTPHRRRKFCKSKEELNKAFESFCLEKEKAGISINLYLGQEIYISNGYKKLFTNGELLSLCDSNYFLIEFDFVEETDVSEVVYVLAKQGFVPVVAHFERYSYANIDMAREIKALGGLIQVNAQSLVGKGKFKFRKLTSKLFKEGLVDIVASDIHCGRVNCMKKAYTFVSKKYGKQIAEDVFKLNAKKIIEG